MKEGESYHIRWFTPDIEMDLCGHATLAAAFVIGNHIDPRKTIVFQSRSGELTATVELGSVSLLFPRRVAVAAPAPEVLLNAVSVRPSEIYKSRDFIFLYDREEQIRKIEIEREQFDKINLDPGGLCVTAKGDEADFVSRYFTPQSTILEDPVTGSAHCSLIPLWSERLGKKDLIALQLSERGGRLLCRDESDHVCIAGSAVIYQEGVLHIP
jgi:predicted PhzF superfamily epimerase YddE/YHI9